MELAVKDDILSRRKEMAGLKPAESGTTERVHMQNALLLAKWRPGICLHRARAYTQIFAETEADPPALRFAKAFARTLEDMPAVIAERELLVGSPTCGIRNALFIPEIASAWLRNEIDILHERPWDPFDVTGDQVAEIKEMLRFWEGKTLFDLWERACPPDLFSRVTGKGWADVWSMLAMHGYHFTPPWEAILGKGLIHYERRVQKAVSVLDVNDTSQMGKHHFYNALLMSIDAVKRFAQKYSHRAMEMAKAQTDPEDRKELLKISEIAAKVPYHPAETFHEAMQAICFIMALMHIEGTGPVYTVGRFDQFMYPYYRADVDSGRLTPGDAQELIELLFIKLTGTVMFWSSSGARCSPGYKPTQTLCIGGVDADGNDATNELSYLVLEAAEAVRTIQPDIVLLCHPRETSREIKMKAAELNALGLGIPKFENTETIKTQLMDIGYNREEASIGWVQGCSEPEGPFAKQYGHAAGCLLNLPMALEAVLYRGKKRMPDTPGSGEQLGLDTGEPSKFASFEELMEAVKRQLSQQILDGHTATSWVEWVSARRFPLIFQSLLTDACIERALPANAGGARISIGPGLVMAGGLATLADSLAAIKMLVFEEKRFTMEQIIEAVDADYEGYEPLRQMLLNKTPKFGNDDDYVDQIAKDIYNLVSTEARKHVTVLGNNNFAMTAWPMSNMFEGAKTWATPDGRKAGKPFSNHIGPTDGLDVNGAVGNINSVTKLDHDRQFGVTHNLYFINVDSDSRMHDMLDLIDYFLSRGGHHLQINCQDKKVFMDAKKHPERYRGLMVRVAGYVAYFVELSEELQDQIIGRTSHVV